MMLRSHVHTRAHRHKHWSLMLAMLWVKRLTWVLSISRNNHLISHVKKYQDRAVGLSTYLWFAVLLDGHKVLQIAVSIMGMLQGAAWDSGFLDHDDWQHCRSVPLFFYREWECDGVGRDCLQNASLCSSIAVCLSKGRSLHSYVYLKVYKLQQNMTALNSGKGQTRATGASIRLRHKGLTGIVC